MAALVLRTLTGGSVAYSSWLLIDGVTVVVSRITQAQYDLFAVTNKGVGDAPGRPAVDARFLLAVGGIPALNTVDGWPSAGDIWIAPDSQRGDILSICLGAEYDWSYFSAVASDPGTGTTSLLSGISVDVLGNIERLLPGEYSSQNPRNTSVVRANYTLASRDLTVLIPPTKIVTPVTRVISNRRSVTFDSTANGKVHEGTSITVSQIVANNSDRYFAAMSASRQGQTLDTVTYAGTGLTARIQDASTARNEYWDLVAPANGTANLVFTYSANTAAVSGGISAYNVDQSTPRSNTGTNSGFTNNPTITITSATGELVLSNVSVDPGANIDIAVDATWTQDWTDKSSTSGNMRNGAGAHKAGAASVTRTDDLTGASNYIWTALAVSLKEAGAAVQIPSRVPWPQMGPVLAM